MTTTIKPAKPATGAAKRPWAALSVLGVAVLAVAAAMVHVQSPPVEPHLVVLPDEEPTASEAQTRPPPAPATVKNGKSSTDR